MNQQHGQVFLSRPIPKRPSQRPEEPTALPKRSSLLPDPSSSEELPSLPEPASLLYSGN